MVRLAFHFLILICCSGLVNSVHTSILAWLQAAVNSLTCINESVYEIPGSV